MPGNSNSVQPNVRARPAQGGVRSRACERTRYWTFIHLRSPGFGPQQARSANLVVDSQENKLRRLEAALFLSPEGQSSRKLAKLAGLADATEARTLIRQLNRVLDEQGRAYRVEEVAGGYALMTRSQFAPWLRRLAHVPGALRLSQSSLETLAVVAYRQPVLRANIEAIRGVGCSEVLKQLMELDLVRISGRSEDLGRPYLYGTTRRFLQMFGLRSADRLPRMEWVNEIHLSMNRQLADFDSESKESTVKKSFSGTSILEEIPGSADETLLENPAPITQAIEDDDDSFDDDDEDIDDDDDYDDEVEDDDEDEDWDDDEVDDEDDDDAEEDDLEEDDAGWEEVDDEDDDELDDDDEDDDLEDDDDDDWDEDEDDDDWD